MHMIDEQQAHEIASTLLTVLESPNDNPHNSANVFTQFGACLLASLSVFGTILTYTDDEHFAENKQALLMVWQAMLDDASKWTKDSLQIIARDNGQVH